LRACPWKEGRKDTKNLFRFSRLAARLLARVPLALLHAIGALLGWAMYGMSPTYRRHFRENLAAAGYEQGTVRRQAIAAAGQLIAEVPAVWFRPREEVVALVRRVVNEDEARSARACGQALLFLTPHMGCFEVTAQYAAARHTPITVLYRPPKIGWLEPLMREGRERPSVRLAPADLSGVREVFGAIRRGEAVGFLPDQVPGEGEGEWAEFFGKPAYTATLAARLAERPGIACFLAYGRRLARGRGYEIVLRRLPPRLPQESATRRINRALEDLIRECPGQYLWGYNRYKSPRGPRPRP
jgi:Kdo2-lipid IVA lauroyltransferase/acyltransferase